MPDHNPALRSTLARLVGGVFNWQFTETFEINGAVIQAIGTELSESDKLEIAGREIKRATSGMVQAKSIVGIKMPAAGDKVIYNGDRDWKLNRFLLSPDGAVYSFLLIDDR